MLTALLVVSALSVSGHTDLPLDMTDDDGLDEMENSGNDTEALGELLGGPCEDTCKETLSHVSCNKKTQVCECDPGYPVRLNVETGCAKPANLGEQCFYYQTCVFTDQNADCVQIKHNAVCQCKEGFHLATVQKPQKRTFCTQDLVVIATDLSTLLGVTSGLAIFTALICFVLKLYSGGRPRHYANTNLAPPIIFAQSASVHSSTSSTKSFSARQYERERENRLLAKARERERGDGGSTSPRSLENLIDGPLPSESWPQFEELKGKAFSPDMLDDPPDGPFPDIDQMDGFENPFALGTENPLGPLALQTHGIENPLGSLVNPEMKIGDPVRRQPPRRMEPLGQHDVPGRGEQRPQQVVWATDTLGQQPLRVRDPLCQQIVRNTGAVGGQQPLMELQIQGHGIENPLASQSDPLNIT